MYIYIYAYIYIYNIYAYICIYIIYIYIYIYIYITEGGTNHLGFQSHLLPLNINTPTQTFTVDKPI